VRYFGPVRPVARPPAGNSLVSDLSWKCLTYRLDSHHARAGLDASGVIARLSAAHALPDLGPQLRDRTRDQYALDGAHAVDHAGLLLLLVSRIALCRALCRGDTLDTSRRERAASGVADTP
jgi:hypothetical protein